MRRLTHPTTAERPNRSARPGIGRVSCVLVSTLVMATLALVGAPSAALAKSNEAAVDWARPDVAGAEAASSSQWTARPPLRQARSGLDVTTVDGQILAVGGFDQENIFDVVEARSVRGPGTWHDLAPMPTARANVATAVVGGLVYAVGGFGDLDDTLNVVERFDPRSGRWATGLPLPQPRGGAGAAGLDGLLYVAGGFIPLAGDDFEIAHSMVVYNPKSNTWRSVAPMPTAREKLRLVASGRYLYAIGGDDLAGQSLTTVERYDPKSNSWATTNPMHESRAVPGAVETKVGERSVLVVVGGVEFAADGTFLGGRRTTEVFDIASGQWRLLDVLLPFNRGSLGCAVEADGTILAIGGGTLSGDTIIYLANVDALSLKDRDLR
jgi:Kelch motif